MTARPVKPTRLGPADRSMSVRILAAMRADTVLAVLGISQSRSWPGSFGKLVRLACPRTATVAFTGRRQQLRTATAVASGAFAAVSEQAVAGIVGPTERV